MNIRQTYQHLLCIFIFGLVFNFSYQTQAQDVTSLKEFITAFDKAKRSYKPSDKQKMLGFYDKAYTGEVIFFPIEGIPSRTQENYRALLASLDTRSVGVDKISESNLRFLKTIIKGNIGIISIEENYQANMDGKVAFKGESFTTITARKVGNSWRIINLNTVILEDARYKGVCVCTLFEGNTKELLAQTNIPVGTKYDTKLDNFNFKKSSAGGTLVTLSNNSFLWENHKDNSLYYLENGDINQKKKLGTARNNKETAILIISKFLYKEKCTEVVAK